MADAEKQVSAQVRGRKILAVRYGAGWETYRPPLMLNESGAYIFRQYMAGNTADKIAEELATMYGDRRRYADRCDAVYQTNGTTGDLVNDEYIIGGKQNAASFSF